MRTLAAALAPDCPTAIQSALADLVDEGTSCVSIMTALIGAGDSALDEYSSDEDLKRYILDGKTATWHYFGTAALGTAFDPTDFKVYGAPNLHVLDAALLPTASYSNPPATAMALARHAAQTNIAKANKTRNSTWTQTSSASAVFPFSSCRLALEYYLCLPLVLAALIILSS